MAPEVSGAGNDTERSHSGLPEWGKVRATAKRRGEPGKREPGRGPGLVRKCWKGGVWKGRGVPAGILMDQSSV